MKINNIADAEKFIDSLTAEPAVAAGIMVNKMIESLELGQMYYEQKDNEKGSLRLAGCLRILKDYRQLIDA